MMDTRLNVDYPEASTIAEFIDAFLDDANNSQKRKPRDILNESLNGFLFKRTTSNTLSLLQDIVKRNKHHPLNADHLTYKHYNDILADLNLRFLNEQVEAASFEQTPNFSCTP